MKRPQAEKLSDTTSAEHPDNLNFTEQIHREKFQNCPIEIIGAKNGEEWFLLFGNARITPSFKTQEELMKYTEEYQWQVFITLMSTIADKIFTIKHEEHISEYRKIATENIFELSKHKIEPK